MGTLTAVRMIAVMMIPMGAEGSFPPVAMITASWTG
jgi:hypothetical protein